LKTPNAAASVAVVTTKFPFENRIMKSTLTLSVALLFAVACFSVTGCSDPATTETPAAAGANADTADMDKPDMDKPADKEMDAPAMDKPETGSAGGSGDK